MDNTNAGFGTALLFWYPRKATVPAPERRNQIMGKNRKTFRHLSFNARDTIQNGLSSGLSIREIAKHLGVSPSTVSREIRRNGIRKEARGYPADCPLAKRKPCCNMCVRRCSCDSEKHYYDCKAAKEKSDETKRLKRQGPDIPFARFARINEIVRAGVEKGQSIEFICTANPELAGMSAHRIRRWINRDLMEVKPAYLRRVRRMYSKKKDYKHKKGGYRAGNAIRYGRTMDDYGKYMESLDGGGAVVVQTDSVVGRKSDGRRLLTIMIPECSFQIGRLYETASAAESVLRETEAFVRELMKHTDREIAIVTDNGTEFASYDLLEAVSGRVHVFFADPYRSSDKAQCERNHELFRYVYPKGCSLDGLTKEDVDEVFSNINSYGRKRLNRKSPYDVAAETFGKGFLDALGMRRVEPKEVNLRAKK